MTRPLNIAIRLCGCLHTDDLEPTGDAVCRERRLASLYHKPLVEGTNNKRKSQGMALFITALCGEMYLVIRDESCAVRFFFFYCWDGGCSRRCRKIDENSRVEKIV